MTLRLRAAETVTAVGHDARSTWASIECAVKRVRATELRSLRGGRIRAACAVVPALTGLERWMAMVEPVLEQSLASQGGADALHALGALDGSRARVGLVVCGPRIPTVQAWLEPLASEVARLARAAEALPERVARALRERGIPPLVVRSAPGDRAAAIGALDVVSELLDDDACDLCVVVAVDSGCEPPLLELADVTGRLHRPEEATGYTPGEAAACLWIERVRAGDGGPGGVTGGALLPGWACAPTPEDALEAALARAGIARPSIREVLVDLNGERAAAEAWVVGATRALWAAGSDPECLLPVVSTGDTGVATAAVALGCAFARLAEEPGVAVVWAGTPPPAWPTGPVASGAVVVVAISR
ncbi:MAG: hypothetical protein HY908_21340 [Myxococcales bacterium]|nr:hypothetical protein [Myxococcales bacterium]